MATMAMTIDKKLRERFAPAHLAIEDESHKHRGHVGHREEGETHFRVEIVSAAFDGQSRVARQRSVYDALKEELAPGGVHALALVTLTPSEAEKRP
jgi:BolA protein